MAEHEDEDNLEAEDEYDVSSTDPISDQELVTDQDGNEEELVPDDDDEEEDGVNDEAIRYEESLSGNEVEDMDDII